MTMRLQTRSPRAGDAGGFTLLELIIAMALFVILGLAAVQLTQRSAGVSVGQQAQSSLNLTMRNVAAQLQIDVVNAGTGYFPTSDIPGAPLGVSVTNTVNPAFDTVTIISFDRTLISHPIAGTDTTSTSITVTPVSPANTATIAAAYKGAELLLVTDSANPHTGRPTITTVPIKATAPGSNTVMLTLTTANVSPSSPSTGTWNADPRQISSGYPTDKGVDDGLDYCYLGTSFDATDWVLKPQFITYWVNTSNQLVRSVDGVDAVIADNILSFKVGSIVEGDSTFSYSPTTVNPRNIRALRLSFIGMTTPDPTNPFRNTMDGGHYRIEAASIIVNPRNLSLHDY